MDRAEMERRFAQAQQQIAADRQAARRPSWRRDLRRVGVGLALVGFILAFLVPGVATGASSIWLWLLSTVSVLLVVASLVGRPKGTLIAAQPPSAVEQPESPGATRDRALDRVEQVRQDYSSRLTDIAYVIEHQGMFDLAHEPARRLTSMLAQVQDTDLNRASTDDLRQLAGDLDASWQAAQQYADRLGYAALRGDPDQARQAAGLARKAADAGTTAPERDALMARLKLVLATLDVVIPRPPAGQLGSPLTGQLPPT